MFRKRPSNVKKRFFWKFWSSGVPNVCHWRDNKKNRKIDLQLDHFEDVLNGVNFFIILFMIHENDPTVFTVVTFDITVEAA